MINDEMLTLYFYGDELDDASRARVAFQLGRDPELAARYATLSAQLSALGRAVEPQSVPAAFNATLHDALIQAATPASTGVASRWMPWSLAATVALAVMLLTFTLRAPQAPPDVIAQTPPAVPAKEQQTLRLVQSHLVQSQLQLVRFETANSDQRSDLVERLIAQNRAIESSARRAGDDDLARVLRAFEPILRQLLGNGPATTASRTQLLEQLNFELGAMLTKLDAPASDYATSL